MMDMVQNAPAVGLTLVIVQVIKSFDGANKLHKWYALIALTTGFGIGWLYAFSLGKDLQASIWDAVSTCAASALAWQLKKAVMEPVGAKFPGDPISKTPESSARDNQ
jgi:hypothetical protein